MSRTGPRDLAVAFRSLARRLHEATGDDGGAPAAQLRSIVDSAAATLGVHVGGDLATSGAAVAAAIEATPADAWDEGRLDRLRELALEAGRILRVAEAEADRDA